MDGSEVIKASKNKIFNSTLVNWKLVSGNSKPGELILNVDRLAENLDIFHISYCCYMIFNLHTVKIEWCSKGVKKLMGIAVSQFQPLAFLSLIHPEDLPLYHHREALSGKFFHTLPFEKTSKYKQRHSFRVILGDGTMKKILQQAIVIQAGKKGEIQRALVTMTDVGFLGDGFLDGLSIVGEDGEPSYSWVEEEGTWEKLVSPLSMREKEILLELAQGIDSKEIGNRLNISMETVKRHRKNMLAKTGSKNASEMVLKALRKGWF